MKTKHRFFLCILIIFSLIIPLDALGLVKSGNLSDIHSLDPVINVSEAAVDITEIIATNSNPSIHMPAPPDSSSSEISAPSTISSHGKSVFRIIPSKIYYSFPSSKNSSPLKGTKGSPVLSDKKAE